MNGKLYEFERPVTDVIRERTSVRTYVPRPLDDGVREKLQSFFDRIKGPFHGKLRMVILDVDAEREDTAYKMGTYGVIRGAPAFIAAACKKTDRNLEDTGYIFETALLYATALGLGTCWLGGTFKRSEFAAAINLGKNEMLPVVSPVGYSAGHRSAVETAMRLGAGSNHRKPWNRLFFKGDFATPLEPPEAGPYAVPLEMVRLAPSASNKQPWRIIIQDGGYHFYLEHTRGYGKVLGYDIQKVDMGIAMCHFELSAREAGLSGQWIVKEPGINSLSDAMEYIVSWIAE